MSRVLALIIFERIMTMTLFCLTRIGKLFRLRILMQKRDWLDWCVVRPSGGHRCFDACRPGQEVHVEGMLRLNSAGEEQAGTHPSVLRYRQAAAEAVQVPRTQVTRQGQDSLLKGVCW